MATNPKLEFFRFKLNHKKENFKTFKDFAILELGGSKSLSDEKTVELCFKHFMKSLSSEHAKDDKIKKTIKVENKKSINKHLDKKPTYNSANHTIFGIINGGPYGRERIISNNDDDEDSSALGLNKSVLLYFYFFIYLPPDHNEGFFMIHSNSDEETITTLFRRYITYVFKGKSFNKATAIEFCPKSFQEEFLKGAILKSMIFKSSFIDNIPTTNSISQLFQNYNIKIEATPRNKNIPGIDAQGFLAKLSKKIFGSKNQERVLEDFEETKVILKSDITSSQKTFEWNTKDKDFIPVVYLKGRIIKKNADDTPDFEELEKYCLTVFKDEILEEIRPDLYAVNYK